MVRISLKWGVLLGIALVVGTQVLTWLGLGLTNWFIGLTYVAVATVAYLSSRRLRAELGEGFTYVNGILTILIVVIISRYIFQSYMYIYTRYVDPNWVQMVSEKWTGMLQEQNVPVERIEQQIATFEKSYEVLPMFTTEIVFIGLSQFILGCIVMGVYKWLSKGK